MIKSQITKSLRTLITGMLLSLLLAGTALAAFGPGMIPQQSFSPEKFNVPNSATVLIVVESNGQETNANGALYAYTRTKQADGSFSAWVPFVNGVPTLLGKRGMGKTKEGDGKTPTGLFLMDTPFGIAAKKEGFPANYLQVNANHYWDGDITSPSYNRLVDCTVNTTFRTEASEHLISSPAYTYAINVGYNSECTKGAGSALFLHCFKADLSNSSGCIAIAEENMEKIMKAYQDQKTVIIIDNHGCFEKYYR